MESLESPGRRDRLFVLLVFIAYVAITSWAAFHHEPWRDEADSWLIMRDAGVSGMLARTGFAGTPALWYLLVAPLTAFDLPYFSQTLLNLGIAWSAALLFLLLAPFPRVTRAAFVFSFYMVHEYSVIARPYALMTLLLFGVAATWRRRIERPVAPALLIALLANTTTHGLVLAAILGISLAIELVIRKSVRARGIVAIVVASTGGALAVAQLRTPADAPHSGIVRMHDVSSGIWALSNAFLPNAPVALGLACAAAVLALITWSLRREWISMAFLWLSTVALSLLFTFVWMGGFRHSGLYLLCAITALWMAGASKDRSRGFAIGALSIALAWSVAAGGERVIREQRQAFSGAEEMAGFIRDNDLAQFEIAAHNIPPAEAILPYLGAKKFWYPAIGRHGSFMTFDNEYEFAIRVPYPSAVSLARRQLAGIPWLLLLNGAIPDPESAGFRLLYATQRPVFGQDDEVFWLYVPFESEVFISPSRHTVR